MKLADEITIKRFQAGGPGSGPRPGMGGPTAKQAFNMHQKNFAELHSKLADRMRERAAAFDKSPQNWGHVGDQVEINKHLAIALAHAGDRSMVDKLGIDY